MLRNIVLTTATAGALALIAYSMPTVPTALATGVRFKSGLIPIAATDNVILVKKGGGGGGGKGHAKGGGGGGGKGHAKGGGGGGGKGHAKGGGGGGGKGHAKGGGGGGGKGHAKGGGGGGKNARHYGDGKSHAKRGGGENYARHDGRGKSHSKRGGGKTIIVYRDGHRYWHNRRIWWWGPLVYSYDPCIRWVRFCPGCDREPINICYDGDYEY